MWRHFLLRRIPRTSWPNIRRMTTKIAILAPLERNMLYYWMLHSTKFAPLVQGHANLVVNTQVRMRPPFILAKVMLRNKKMHCTGNLCGMDWYYPKIHIVIRKLYFQKIIVRGKSIPKLCWIQGIQYVWMVYVKSHWAGWWCSVMTSLWRRQVPEIDTIGRFTKNGKRLLINSSIVFLIHSIALTKQFKNVFERW